ncbi:hypothetical protein FHG87_018641, partial [Trinorchestia longiramus]
IWSSVKLPGGCGLSDGFMKRRVYTHTQYIRLIMNGELPDRPHDYSVGNTNEDPRMLAFFDSLIQREIDSMAVMSDESDTDSSTDSESSSNDLDEPVFPEPNNDILSTRAQKIVCASKGTPMTSGADAREGKVDDVEVVSSNRVVSGTSRDGSTRHSNSLKTIIGAFEATSSTGGDVGKLTRQGYIDFEKEKFAAESGENFELLNSQGEASVAENSFEYEESPLLMSNRENLLDVLNPSESYFQHSLRSTLPTSARGSRWNPRTAHRRNRALERLASIHLNRRTRRHHRRPRFSGFMGSMLTLAEVLELCSDVGIDVQEMLDEHERLYLGETGMRLDGDHSRAGSASEDERSSSNVGQPNLRAGVDDGGSGEGASEEEGTTDGIASIGSVTAVNVVPVEKYCPNGEFSTTVNRTDGQANNISHAGSCGGDENSVEGHSIASTMVSTGRDIVSNKMPVAERNLCIEDQTISTNICNTLNIQNASDLSDCGNSVTARKLDDKNSMLSNNSTKGVHELVGLEETELSVNFGVPSSIPSCSASLNEDVKRKLTSIASHKASSNETSSECDAPSSSLNSNAGFSNEAALKSKQKRFSKSSFGLGDGGAPKPLQSLKRKRNPDSGGNSSSGEDDISPKNETKILRAAECLHGGPGPGVLMQSVDAGVEDSTATQILADKNSCSEVAVDAQDSPPVNELNSEIQQPTADSSKKQSDRIGSESGGPDREHFSGLRKTGHDTGPALKESSSENAFATVEGCEKSGECRRNACDSSTGATGTANSPAIPQRIPENASGISHSSHDLENTDRNPSVSVSQSSPEIVENFHSPPLVPPSPEPVHVVLPTTDDGLPQRSYSQGSRMFGPEFVSSFVNDVDNYEISDYGDNVSDDDFTISSNLFSGLDTIEPGSRRIVISNEIRRRMNSWSIGNRRSNTTSRGRNSSSSSSSRSNSSSDSESEDDDLAPPLPNRLHVPGGKLQSYKQMLHFIYLKRLQLEERKRRRRIERRLRRRAGRVAHRVFVREQRRQHMRQLLRGWRIRNSEATRRLTSGHRLRECTPWSISSSLGPPPSTSAPLHTQAWSNSLQALSLPPGVPSTSTAGATSSGADAAPSAAFNDAPSTAVRLEAAVAPAISADVPGASVGFSVASRAEASVAEYPEDAGVGGSGGVVRVHPWAEERCGGTVGPSTFAVSSSDGTYTRPKYREPVTIPENVPRSRFIYNLLKTQIEKSSFNIDGSSDFSESSSSNVAHTSNSIEGSFIATCSSNIESCSSNAAACANRNKARSFNVEGDSSESTESSSTFTGNSCKSTGILAKDVENSSNISCQNMFSEASRSPVQVSLSNTRGCNREVRLPNKAIEEASRRPLYVDDRDGRLENSLTCYHQDSRQREFPMLGECSEVSGSLISTNPHSERSSQNRGFGSANCDEFCTDQPWIERTPDGLADRSKETNPIVESVNRNSAGGNFNGDSGDAVTMTKNCTRLYEDQSNSGNNNLVTELSRSSDSAKQAVVFEQSLVNQPVTNSNQVDQNHSATATKPMEHIASGDLHEFRKGEKSVRHDRVEPLSDQSSSLGNVNDPLICDSSDPTYESNVPWTSSSDLGSIASISSHLETSSSSIGSVLSVSSRTSGTNSMYSIPGFRSSAGSFADCSLMGSGVSSSRNSAHVSSTAFDRCFDRQNELAVSSVFDVASGAASCRQRMHDAMLSEPNCSSRSKRVIAPYTLVEGSLKDSYLYRSLSSYDDMSNDDWDFGSTENRTHAGVGNRSLQHRNGQRKNWEDRPFSEGSSVSRNMERDGSSFGYRVSSSKTKFLGEGGTSRASHSNQVFVGSDDDLEKRGFVGGRAVNARSCGRDGELVEKNVSTDGDVSNDDGHEEDCSIRSTLENVSSSVITCNNVVLSVTSNVNETLADAGDISSRGCEKDVKSDHVPKDLGNTE